jgi:hypothetical protein
VSVITLAKSGQRGTGGIAAVSELLVELARVLLPRGMTPKLFGELARYAFVQAAADAARFRNGRVNCSRVAAQTGLTRADVRRLLRQREFDSEREGLTPLERVIRGWRTDREFANRPGHPKRLTYVGRGSSFARLVRKYGGDIPPRAVLEELRGIRVLRDSGGRVQLQTSPSSCERRDFSFLSAVLPDLIDGLRIASRRTARDKPTTRAASSGNSRGR